MNNNTSTNKLKFIGQSLIWASILYGCVFGVFQLTEMNKNKNEPVSLTQTSSKQTIPIHISVDSLQKNINITGKVFGYLMNQIRY